MGNFPSSTGQLCALEEEVIRHEVRLLPGVAERQLCLMASDCECTPTFRVTVANTAWVSTQYSFLQSCTCNEKARDDVCSGSARAFGFPAVTGTATGPLGTTPGSSKCTPAAPRACLSERGGTTRSRGGGPLPGSAEGSSPSRRCSAASLFTGIDDVTCNAHTLPLRVTSHFTPAAPNRIRPGSFPVTLEHLRQVTWQQRKTPGGLQGLSAAGDPPHL